ncbi:hypothetical protein EDC63_11958 [Sulfurirhabdus autotrophica]|uniref:Uncharacterized protein n=1 Tax=Sulfurirhabdus autotrophica TaxID=1706046 RepID=A0A4R3XVD2_9PROT|nr:hypothetical protein EDC63_11958 [Sulfurirhabdus autotrophica]
MWNNPASSQPDDQRFAKHAGVSIGSRSFSFGLLRRNLIDTDYIAVTQPPAVIACVVTAQRCL